MEYTNEAAFLVPRKLLYESACRCSVGRFDFVGLSFNPLGSAVRSVRPGFTYRYCFPPFKELMVECTKSWQPNKLCVVWTRRSRRKTTELLSWQPTIQNPYRGLVVWPVPENVDITVTLFQDPKATDYEDKVRIITAKPC